MIEMAAVVAAEHPKPQVAVQRRVSSQESLKPHRHLLKLGAGEYAVDPAVESPNELSRPHRLRQEHADAVDWTGSQLSFDHHHPRALRIGSIGATNASAKSCASNGHDRGR
jgi:hypothetical protein